MSSLDDIIEDCRVAAYKENAGIEPLCGDAILLVVRLPPGIYAISDFQRIQNIVREVLDSQDCKIPVLVIDHNIDVFAVPTKDVKRIL